jgi:hypothetical protein
MTACSCDRAKIIGRNFSLLFKKSSGSTQGFVIIKKNNSTKNVELSREAEMTELFIKE